MTQIYRSNARYMRFLLLMPIGGLCLLPAWCAAQGSAAQAAGGPEEKQQQQQPEKQQEKQKLETGKVKIPVSPNPLKLPENPEIEPAFPIDPKSTGPDFRDYRQSVANPDTAGKSKQLSLFGYEFFQPAREIIEMHRAWLKQRYSLPKREDEKASAKQVRANEAPGGAPREGADGADRRDDTAQANENRTQFHRADDAEKREDSRLSLPGERDRAGEAGLPASAQKGTGASSRPGSASPDPVNAYEEVADPLSQLYRNVTASIPPTYRLAPGDSVTVRYGSAKHEYRSFTAAVDSQGSIIVPEMGVLVLRGLTVTQAEKALQTQMRRFYNGIEASITLGKLRTIQVTVSGLSFQPGSYAVPAVATAYNVLYASGGPTETGSLRAVEVRRQGKLVATLDMYKYWLTGTQADIPLQDGDLIYIPPRRSRISVSGEVLHPALFELAQDETLHDALEYAGGVKASGVDQRVQINTLVPGTARILKDIDLKQQSASSQQLYDGDAVDVFSVRPLLANRVTLEGAVDQPSDYALETGMKISDLLVRARGTLADAFLTRADLYRLNADNTTTLIPINLEKALAHDPAQDVALSRWDRLKVYTRQEVAWSSRRTMTVRGAVSRPGLYSRSDEMHVADALLMAGGPAPDAFLERAVLLHQHGDGSFDIEYVNLDTLTAGDRANRGPLIKDNDILAVYKIGEAQYEPEHTVTIKGEVVAPGPYPRGDGMRLSDLLKLSGGFKPGAGVKVVVAHARKAAGANNGALQTLTVNFDQNRYCAPQDDARLEDGDVVMVQGMGGFVDHVQTITVRGAVNNPGPLVLSNKRMTLSDAIREAGGLRPEAFAAGAEFQRDPKMMATDSQRSLASIIGGLNDLLNDITYKRERGKSFVERIKSVSTATQNDALPLAGQSAAPNTSESAPLAAALAQQEIVSPARKLTEEQMNASGSIAVNLPEALRRPKGFDDVLLADGDTITIPETPTTVQVIGAVFHGRGVLYRPGEKLDYYVAQAGGFSPDAARDRIEIIHVGGGLIPAAKAGKLLPGDVVLVPTRVLAEKLASHQDGFSSFFKSLTNSAIIFRVASSLFGL